MNPTTKDLVFADGVKDGLPICIGYFPTALAFGLVCRSGGLRLWESMLFSLTNFAGSGQFLAVNLLFGGAMITELVISVFLVNLRYLFMGAAVAQNASSIRGAARAVVAFGTTDEVFSVSLLRDRPLNTRYMVGLEGISYLGWNAGTVVGFLIGSLFPPALQLAIGVTLYAMFSSLLAQECKARGTLVLLIGAISAVLDSILVLCVHMASGWAFVISMLTATVIGALLDKEKEA